MGSLTITSPWMSITLLRSFQLFPTGLPKENYQESYEYKTIMSHTYKIHTEEEGASTAMRLLIHYVGDIHQPLHATSRVNHEYTSGDKGGNAFPLPAKDGANELHAVWDSVIYEYTGYPKTPF